MTMALEEDNDDNIVFYTDSEGKEQIRGSTLVKLIEKLTDVKEPG